MTSATNYEKKFREFLSIKRQWTELVNSLARFHSENAYGQLMRPIAITNDVTILERAKNLVQQWKRFADFAEQCREEGSSSGSRNDYWPVPFIVSGAIRIFINEGTAQAISKVSREKLLSKLERRKNTLLREGMEHSNEFHDCEFDIERFEKYEFGTIFRRRLAGYADTIITVNRMDEHEFVYRAGTWGVLIDSRILQEDVNYRKKGKQIKSFYEFCTPIMCSLYDSGALYLEEEVLRVKEEQRIHPKRATPANRGKRRKLEDIYEGETKPDED